MSIKNMDNDSVSNASSYQARGPLRNIIKAAKKDKVKKDPVEKSRTAEILIEADSSDDEIQMLASEDSQSLQSMDVASQSQASVAASSQATSNARLSHVSDQRIMFVLNKVLKGQNFEEQEETKGKNYGYSEEKKVEKNQLDRNNSAHESILQLPNPQKESKKKPARHLSQNNVFVYEDNQNKDQNTNIEVVDKDQPKKMISKMASMGIDNEDNQINENNMNFLKQWQKDINIDKESDNQSSSQPHDEETQEAIAVISRVISNENNSNLDMCDQLSNLSAQQKEKLAEIPFEELVRLIHDNFTRTGKYIKRPCN